MDAKHRAAQLFGIVALVCGGLFGIKQLKHLYISRILAVHGYPSDVLFLILEGLSLAVAAGVMWIGLWGLRWAKGEVVFPKIKWGRILLGSYFILTWLADMAGLFFPVPKGPLPLFEPQNQEQARAMKVTEVTMLFLLPSLGAWLIVSGIRATRGTRTHGEENSKIVPQRH